MKSPTLLKMDFGLKKPEVMDPEIYGDIEQSVNSKSIESSDRGKPRIQLEVERVDESPLKNHRKPVRKESLTKRLKIPLSIDTNPDGEERSSDAR